MSGLGIETLIPTEAVTSPAFVGIRLALDLAYGMFVLGGMLRRSAVRGSHPRYRWATVQRTACWPAMIFIIMSTMRAISLTMPLGLLLIPAILAAWVYTFRQMRTDGDDDWFTGASKRLKRWARGLSSRGAATGAATAGASS